MMRVSTKRPTATGEGRAGGNHRIGCLAAFDPVDHCLQHIELIECRRAGTAMPHTRYEIGPAEIGAHLRKPAGTGRHTLVIVDGVEGREPRIADAVKKS